MKVNDFLSISSPIRVEIAQPDGPGTVPCLLLAFAIERADEGDAVGVDGLLTVMVLPLAGGVATFHPIEDVTFPPAVVSGPVPAQQIRGDA